MRWVVTDRYHTLVDDNDAAILGTAEAGAGSGWWYGKVYGAPDREAVRQFCDAKTAKAWVEDVAKRREAGARPASESEKP